LHLCCSEHHRISVTFDIFSSPNTLKEWTTHYGFELRQIIFEPYHQLRRVHIVRPSLTHLRFSSLQREVDFGVIGGGAGNQGGAS
jgi:hypothetical protein